MAGWARPAQVACRAHYEWDDLHLSGLELIDLYEDTVEEGVPPHLVERDEGGLSRAPYREPRGEDH